jgi:purine-binding chemotaxis protein CheW
MNQGERRYLIFKMCSSLFSFELSQVAEVSEPPQLWPIPSRPSHYPGAMNFHGSIVAVMDLAAFLNLEGCAPKHEKLIVLNSRVAALGFLVEDVIRIIPAEEAADFQRLDDGFCSGTFIFSDSMIRLLDPARIAARAAETING